MQRLCLFVVAWLILAAAYWHGYQHGQVNGVNALIADGFVVVDPEGFVVAEFGD